MLSRALAGARDWSHYEIHVKKDPSGRVQLEWHVEIGQRKKKNLRKG